MMSQIMYQDRKTPNPHLPISLFAKSLYRLYIGQIDRLWIVVLCISGCLSSNHSCLEDGSHLTITCPEAPATTGSAKGTPSNPPGNCGLHQSPGRPLLYDFEGNRRERAEYGKMSDGVVNGQSKWTVHEHVNVFTQISVSCCHQIFCATSINIFTYLSFSLSLSAHLICPPVFFF